MRQNGFSITGNQGVPEGDAGKDYIFVSGDSSNYNVSGVDHPQNHQNNTVDNVQITNNTTGSHPIGNANGIEGIVFGDGPSSLLGGSTDVSHSVTLNVDIDLASSDSSDHLTSVTLSGIPEGAQFTGDHTSVTWDPDHGSYTLTFDDNTTHYEGQVSVALPEGQNAVGDITMEVNSTASDHHDTEFHFNGEEGGQFVSGAEPETTSDHAADDTGDTAHVDATSVEIDHTADASHVDATSTETSSTSDAPQVDATSQAADDASHDSTQAESISATAQDADADNTHDADTATDHSAQDLSLLDTEDIFMDFDHAGGAESHSQDDNDHGRGHAYGHENEPGGGHAYGHENEPGHGRDNDHQADNAKQGGHGESDATDKSHDTADHDNGDRADHTLNQEQPINFSDILHDGDEHQDLANLIQGPSAPAVPVDPKDPDHHGHGAPPVEGQEDAGHGAGGHDDMDNLIAKPDTDANS